jgi:biofilm PGA synthesis lipoprotein PgaB
LSGPAAGEDMNKGEFLVLCYHAVPHKAVPYDLSGSVPQRLFVEQMEYLRTHGYNPVSLDDILKAAGGKRPLPPKPVLLTFDDAYRSYYDFVVPVLEKFNYPSVVSVVGRFIDNLPKDFPEPLMTWDQLKDLSSRRLVEVVSHTYDLHKEVRYNPQGSVASAVNVRTYDSNKKTYETEEEYRARIEKDFNDQNELFRKNLGFVPKAIAWPYGRYNSISLEIAEKAGYLGGFSVEKGFASINRLHRINRTVVINEPIEGFIKMIQNPDGEKPHIRAVQVDLDLIYDPDPEKTDQNLGKLINRLVEMKVNTVFLQAFADPDGTGNIKSVYFPNRVLPVRADIFSHAVHQMMTRQMKVYAWMPTLSIEIPDKELNKKLRVHEFAEGEIRPSRSSYNRLSPFSSEVKKLIKLLYEDLAIHSQIQGVLFQDDAYLTDREDYHPAALSKYESLSKGKIQPDEFKNNPELNNKWARYKTEALIDFTVSLMDEVRRYRPDALFGRNLYSIVLTEPESEMWFAQDYEIFLKTYDEVVVMAYPQMEKVKNQSEWLEGLVEKAKGFPDGIEKTVFKIQAYDWANRSWVEDELLLEEMRDILSSGGRHIAYYPDNLWMDKPDNKKIRLEMSTKTYPFIP